MRIEVKSRIRIRFNVKKGDPDQHQRFRISKKVMRIRNNVMRIRNIVMRIRSRCRKH